MINKFEVHFEAYQITMKIKHLNDKYLRFILILHNF